MLLFDQKGGDNTCWLTSQTNTVTVRQEQISPGGRLNKKDGLTRYGDSHVKDKTS